MYRAMGQEQQPPADPFIHRGESASCLSPTWPSAALMCAQAAEGMIEPTAAPSEEICSLFVSPSRRTEYNKYPICWEVTDSGERFVPLSHIDCNDEAQRGYLVEQLADCVDDPFSSARCALFMHPSMQAVFREQCGDALFQEARDEAKSRDMQRVGIVVGAFGVAAAGAYLFLQRWRRRG